MSSRNKSSTKNVNKLRVAVLMGGPSSEHEVSLNTGAMVLAHLNRRKYHAKPFVIDKNGRWPIPINQLKKDFDIAFIAMHGEYGEDGQIQSLLEQNRIRYTGSNSQASSLGMNKEKSLRAFQKAGLCVADFVTDFVKAPQIGLPCVVKPIDRGSSVGVNIVKKYGDLVPAIKEARRCSKKVMIQKYIKGKEFTCGVIDHGKNAVSLLPTEIIPQKSAFFDYKAKYAAGSSKEITPPPSLSKEQIMFLQQMALAAHWAIGAHGLSRTDFILGADGKFYVLEINTLPGMTETSLLPQAAKAVGISFPKLLDIVIESGLKKK